MKGFNANTVDGGQVRIVEKRSERADLGLAGMVYVADDGTEYVTVGNDSMTLVEKAKAEEPVEFEPAPKTPAPDAD